MVAVNITVYQKHKIFAEPKILSLCVLGFLLVWVSFLNADFLVLDNFFFFLGLFAISWAAFAAYGGSQARGPIRAVAVDLHHSHSNTGSEPPLRPTPQLKATLDP